MQVEENITNTENEQQQIKKDKILTHIDISVNKLKKLMQRYISNDSSIDKADKLAFWLEDYVRFLNFEDTFNPTYFKRYERGDIIKANLGYNVGNEEGGLHYCVVVDRKNLRSSGIITVVPLTSYKGKETHYTSVFLGDEIYKNFKEKYDALMLQLSAKINSISIQTSKEELQSALDDFAFLQSMDDEITKMKKGSVALVSQITTISKQRIYNPQKKRDILSGVQLSETSLDLINDKIKELYIK